MCCEGLRHGNRGNRKPAFSQYHCYVATVDGWILNTLTKGASEGTIEALNGTKKDYGDEIAHNNHVKSTLTQNSFQNELHRGMT